MMTTSLHTPSMLPKPRRFGLPTFALLAFTILVAGTSGCAALRGQRARTQHIRMRTETLVYNQPIQAVWPQAQAMLFERGLATKATDSGGAYVLETEWAQESGKGGRMVRYLVQGAALSESTCQVHFTRMQQDKDGAVATGRDLDMEWMLIQRADATTASAILAEADSAGAAARAQNQ